MTDDQPGKRAEKPANPTSTWNWGLGIAFGVGIGIALGTALGNMAFMAVGIAFFPVIAMVFRSRPKGDGAGDGPTGGHESEGER
jgi:hypothetical protein